jgi:formylglycine-generating enzyme required for sulfatase activity
VLPPLESVLVPTKPLEAGSAAGAPAGPQTAEVSGPPRVLQPSERWVNSLGMRFASVPDVGGLCAIWPVRLLDFETFARETGHDTGDQMWTLKRDGRNEREGNNWRKPGFIQGTDHPIVGVSWEDAQAFCRWLTDTERAQGVLAAGQTYRLPTDREWSLAAGLAGETGDSPMERSGPQQSLCPWGTGWPPTQTAGNYAGEEVREEEWPEEWPVIPGYQDGYPRTSPVGSFPPNAYGLYDLSGNVWEWCEDFYNGRSGARVLRGGSWANNTRDKLRWSARYYGSAGVRYDCYGFRVVLSLGAAAF